MYFCVKTGHWVRNILEWENRHCFLTFVPQELTEGEKHLYMTDGCKARRKIVSEAEQNIKQTLFFAPSALLKHACIKKINQNNYDIMLTSTMSNHCNSLLYPHSAYLGSWQWRVQVRWSLQRRGPGVGTSDGTRQQGILGRSPQMQPTCCWSGLVLLP